MVLKTMIASEFYDASEIERLLGYDVKQINGKINIGFWLNMDQPEYEDVMEELKTIDTFLLSPVD